MLPLELINVLIRKEIIRTWTAYNSSTGRRYSRRACVLGDQAEQILSSDVPSYICMILEFVLPLTLVAGCQHFSESRQKIIKRTRSEKDIVTNISCGSRELHQPPSCTLSLSGCIKSP